MNVFRFVCLMLLGLACTQSSVQAQGLGAGSYRTYIMTPEGNVDSDFLPVPTNVSYSYNGIDSQGNPYSYTGRAAAGAGRVPIADIDGAGSGSFGSFNGALAESKIFYSYRVMARAGSTRTTVPLLITIAGDARITGTGSFPRAVALAETIVRRPGTVSILVGAVASAQMDTIVMRPSDSFSMTHSTVVNVGQTGRVELRARGEVFNNAEVSATADPIFVIDPDATYDEGGQTYYYADEFEIEYSDAVVQWTPCPADLTDDGALDFFDVSAFLTAYSTGDYIADYTGDAIFDFFDVSAFLSHFAKGCP